MNLNDFSKLLQYNKEWKIEGGLNTFRTHCIFQYKMTEINSKHKKEKMIIKPGVVQPHSKFQ